MKEHKMQDGFSVVAVLIILAVIGLIVALGWSFYRQTQNVTNTTTESPRAEGEAQIDEQKYLVIQEFGVKIPLNDKISDLTYEVSGKGLNLHDKNQAVVKLYTARYKDARANCSENSLPISLNRGLSADVPIMGDGPGPDDIEENTYGYLHKNNLIKPDGMRTRVGIVKVGDYYYTDLVYPGGACENYNDPVAQKARDDEPVDAIAEAIKAMKSL